MKKFTNITGTKVGEEPIVDNRINEEEEFKYKVLNLMDKLLTIRTYGPVDRYLRAGLIKISGQTMFVESLMDLLQDNNAKKEVKILESLKSSVKDWESIDSKIEEININLEKAKENRRLKIHESKLLSMYKSYGEDKDLFMSMIDESCNKITSQEIAEFKSRAAKNIAERGYQKDIFELVSDKYSKTSIRIKSI